MLECSTIDNIQGTLQIKNIYIPDRCTCQSSPIQHWQVYKEYCNTLEHMKFKVNVTQMSREKGGGGGGGGEMVIGAQQQPASTLIVTHGFSVMLLSVMLQCDFIMTLRK